MKIQLNIRLLPLLKTPKHRKGSFMPFSAPVFCSLCLWCSFVHVPMTGCGPCFCFHLGCVPSSFPLIGTSLTIRCWTSLFVLRTNPPPNTHPHMHHSCPAYFGSDPERLAKRKGQSGGCNKKVNLDEMEGNTFFLCFLTKIPFYVA